LEKVIPRFITSCILEEPLRVHGDGSAARDFVFVTDTCEAIDLLMHADINAVKGQTFNVASTVDRSIFDIAKTIVGMMDKDESVITFVGDRPGQVFRHAGDNSKMKDLFDWKPSKSWEMGLKETIDWYRSNRSWWEKQLWMRAVPIITKNGKKELH
jgi:dTDP-glucose 4,6-dehydratase